MTTSQPPTSMPRRVGLAVAALIALLLVIGGVPVLLVWLDLVPHGLPSWHEITTSLSSRDSTGLYFRIAGGVVVWTAWAVYTTATAKEVAASIRRRGRRRDARPPRGLAWFSPAFLVAAIAVLFVAAPAVTNLIDAAHASPAATPPAASVSTQAAPTPASGTIERPESTPVSHAPTSEHSPLTYTVQRYDTLWSIAAQHLPGNPADRYKDIAALNPDKIGPQDRILPDTVLRMPADAYGLPPAGTSSHTITVPVERGDTFSGLAAEHGIKNWRTQWPANEDRPEPDGQRFTDPDHIEPGWMITLTSAAGTAEPGTAPQSSPSHHAPPLPRQNPPASPPRNTPAAPAPAPVPRAQTPAQDRPTAPEQVAPQPRPQPTRAPANGSSAVVTVAEWTAGLAGGAGILAAGAFVALRRYRRRQFRYRRPGRAVAGPAPQHVPLEQVLLTAGAAGVRDVDFIDRALRSLAAALSAAEQTLPAIVAARLTENHFDLALAHDAPAPPAPWVAVNPTSWVVDKTAELPPPSSDSAPAAPYPTLVSVGCTEDGQEWLIDLERAGSLIIDGDPARGADLARFIIAELAHNIWSDHLTVTVGGQFGAELVELNPARLVHADDLAAAARAAAADVCANLDVAGELDMLQARLQAVHGDTWMPQVLVMALPGPAVEAEDSDAIQNLLETVTAPPAPTAAAVVLVPPADAPTSPAGLRLTVDSNGRLQIPALDVCAAAQQLPAGQARELASYMALLREPAADVPMPIAPAPAPGERAYTDVVGAVLLEHTLTRPAPPTPGVAGPSAVAAASLLPDPDHTYLTATAASEADIVTLAPVVKPEVGEALLTLDPRLDEDLAAWRDPDTRRPKLRLLGGIDVTAFGTNPEGKIAQASEAVAYFALHPAGVTGDKFADEFWPRGKRPTHTALAGERPGRIPFTMRDPAPKNLVSIVRSWLATDPVTGQPCLPYAKASARPSGSSMYRVQGLLVDWDLFTRLRRRAQARGAEGLADLVAALDLVTGAPLSGLRPGGGAWLTPGGTVDTPDAMTAAIVDVAHVVVTRALADGDTALARRAAELADGLDSGSDTPLLDLAAVCEAQGRTAELGATVRRIVTHHGGELEEDVPADTYAIMLRRGWIGLTQAS